MGTPSSWNPSHYPKIFNKISCKNPNIAVLTFLSKNESLVQNQNYNFWQLVDTVSAGLRLFLFILILTCWRPGPSESHMCRLYLERGDLVWKCGQGSHTWYGERRKEYFYAGHHFRMENWLQVLIPLLNRFYIKKN